MGCGYMLIDVRKYMVNKLLRYSFYLSPTFFNSYDIEENKKKKPFSF